MTVLIGRRELFAFAERYSSYRLKDYSDLADGVVLCSLFNLLFPDLRIRAASPQTHTLSQRTQMNWAALRNALDVVGIPHLLLLDQEALLHGNPEKGFSALVLFYFLFNLTKRTDFSAEFASDVTEELTGFLQSIDSIAALVSGGALPLHAVPPQLQEQLRIVTTLRKNESVSIESKRKGVNKKKQNINSLSSSSSISSMEVSETDDDDDDIVNNENFQKQLSFNSEITSVGPQPILEETKQVEYALDNLNIMSPQQIPSNYTSNTKKEIHHNRNTNNKNENSNKKSKEFKSTNNKQNILETISIEREVELQQALIKKSEECEELKMQGVQLLSQLAKLRAEKSINTSSSIQSEYDNIEQKKGEEQERRRLKLVEDELQHLRRILQNTKQEGRNKLHRNDSLAEELLNDVIDSETGKVVNVHEIATLLNGVILDTLRDSRKRRQEAQKWLWLIISAYHVVETRLVTACEVADMEWQRLKGINNNNNNNKSPSEWKAESPVTPSTTAKIIKPFQEEKSNLFSSSKDITVSHLQTQISKMESEMMRRQEQFENYLNDLHKNEIKLRERTHLLEEELKIFSQKSQARELKWRQLCAAIHEAARTSFEIAEAESEEIVAGLLTQREAWYSRSEEEAQSLMSEELKLEFNLEFNFKKDKEIERGEHDVCVAMQTLVQSVSQDRDRLQRELTGMRKQQLEEQEQRKQEKRKQAAEEEEEEEEEEHKRQKGIHKISIKDEIRSRLMEQKEYEEDEVWCVRDDARPPFTLSCPSIKTVENYDLNTTPCGRNLSALLSSITPMK